MMNKHFKENSGLETLGFFLGGGGYSQLELPHTSQLQNSAWIRTHWDFQNECWMFIGKQ